MKERWWCNLGGHFFDKRKGYARYDDAQGNRKTTCDACDQGKREKDRSRAGAKP